MCSNYFQAFIRLAEEAAPMLERMKEKNEGRICFNSVELEARVLEGDTSVVQLVYICLEGDTSVVQLVYICFDFSSSLAIL